MTLKVNCGDVVIGGGAPVSIQSMTNVNSRDEKALLNQIAKLEDAGCQIIRMAVPDLESAETLGKVKKKIHIPMVADIHFDYRLAIASIKAGADKIRINPGNIGDTERISKVVSAAKERNIPIRVGVNSGSLEKELIQKYKGVTARGLAESAINNLRLIEDLGYDNLVVSLKSSDVRMNYDAHKILSAGTEHPIHIGITEAGTLSIGKVKSAVGIGGLLLAGIGDTMRVSLTADPVEEVFFAKEILKSLGMREASVRLVSCPTCGRTRVNLEKLACDTQEALKPIEKIIESEGRKSITVAVMGCGVNGPGEAREADYGVAGGDGKGVLFSRGEIVATASEENIVDELIKLIIKGEDIKI